MLVLPALPSNIRYHIKDTISGLPRASARKNGFLGKHYMEERRVIKY